MMSKRTLRTALGLLFLLPSIVLAQPQWEWQNPIPTSNDLKDVWGSSGSDVFAVGTHGTIAHYNGIVWSLMTSGTTETLYGVWGSGSRDVFAVGYHGIILHYDGCTWSRMISGTTEALYEVWGNGGRDVFAVGYHGTILHYNGSTWSRMTSDTTSSLKAVWGSGGSHVFAVGYWGMILHYDGATWAPMASGTTEDLFAVWGSSSSDLFAMGYDTILHYDGMGWSPITNGTGLTMLDVWGSGGSDVFAVGSRLTILHYDGADWSVMDSGLLWWSPPPLSGVWGSSGSDVFAVGELGLILHYDGTSWSVMNGTDDDIYDIWGSGGSDVYAVGDHSILHYDGAGWSQMITDTDQPLRGVWGDGQSDVFVVGFGGTILHYDGASWTPMTSDTTHSLMAVWGSSGNDVFTVGSGGAILHYDGTGWSPMASGTTEVLRGVWGSSGVDVFVVGDDTILHYNGTEWSPMTSGTDQYVHLDDVWGSSGRDVFAVGDDGILHYDGASWAPMVSSACWLRSIWGSSGSNVFAVTDCGTILHYDGVSWSPMTIETDPWFYAVWGSSASDVFVGGSYGTILHYGIPSGPPTVATTTVTSITANGATSGGNITSDGGASVTDRGVCWSTSDNPTTSDTCTHDGTSVGSFTSTLTGLNPGTPYHVRAYATNSAGTGYGTDVTFSTLSGLPPTVATKTVTSITANSAASGGNITSGGGASVTDRGVCWSTSANPTTSDTCTHDGTGVGSFNSTLTGLNAGTPYHVRAYATNSAGTGYGGDVSFSTASAQPPTVATTAVTSITANRATSGGNITSNGGASVTDRGVCWSTSANPTTSNARTHDGTGVGSFTSTLTGLNPGTPYHVRAYATNSAGTGYGSDLSFSTVSRHGLNHAALLLLLDGGGSVPPPICTIPNGGFESGHTAWSELSTHGWEIITHSSGLPISPHGGSHSAWLGGEDDDVSYVSQQVTISSSCPYLIFYHRISSEDECGYDYGYVRINGANVSTIDLCESQNTGGWVVKSINLGAFAGQPVTLQIRAETDGVLNSNWFIDDVTTSSSSAASAISREAQRTSGTTRDEATLEPSMPKRQMEAH